MSDPNDASLDDTLPSSGFEKVDIASADTRATAAPAAAEPVVEKGATIGRYVVVEKLGSGTMGLVLAAFDPTLDRKVALKLVKGDQSGSTVGRQRLQREAQAMAKLAHPNVVTVFEVGTYGDRVFLAMEYVAGETLEQWLETPRSQREILRAFVAAGEGLAAAHRAGIVHRDFKPQNVLVSSEGRVRVADFGLATASVEAPPEPSIDAPARSSQLELSMTKTGAVLGTPAYMSPEQHRGKPADARADQFSFCVALYEALYGELPFEGTQYLVYADNVMEGRIREAPKKTVPAWIRKVLLHGLQTDPAARYPSMDALLVDLGNDPAQKRQRLFVVGGALAFAGLAVGTFALTRSHAESDPCANAAEPVADVWTEKSAKQLEAALLASNVPGARDAVTHATKLFEARAGQLRLARRDACVATAVRHDQSSQLLDRRMHCIDKLADETRALRDVLSEKPDELAVHKSISSIASLAPVASCSDTAALLAAVPPPPNADIRARADGLGKQLDRAQALEDTGHYEDARKIAKAVVEEADKIDYVPLRARAHFIDAEIASDLGNYDEAANGLRAVGEMAAAAHDDTLYARSQILLYGVVGFRQQRTAEARGLEPAVAAAVVRAGNPLDLQGHLDNARSLVAMADGNYDKAITHMDSAAKKLEQALGPTSPKVAAILGNRATVLEGAGRYDEALVSIDKSLAISVELQGAQHPDVAVHRYQRGSLLDTMGKPAESLAEFQKASAIDEAMLPADSPKLAENYMSIGVVLLELGKKQESLDQLQRALAMFEKHPDDNDQAIEITLLNLARTQQALDRTPDALKTYERALTLAKTRRGADDLSVADILMNMGESVEAAGDHKKALGLFEEALRIREAKLGPNHPDVARAIGVFGEVAFARKEWPEVIRRFDKAIAILEKNDETPLIAELLTMRGKAHAALGHKAQADVDAKRAAELTKSK